MGVSEEEARARAQAEAEADSQFSAAPDVPKASPEMVGPPYKTFGSELAGDGKGILGDLGGWASSFGHEALGIIKAPYESIVNSLPNDNNSLGTWDEGSQKFVLNEDRYSQVAKQVANPIKSFAEPVASMFPGGRTAVDLTSDYLTGDMHGGADYGKALRNDLAGGVLQAGIFGAGSLIEGSAARSAAKTAAIEDPVSQAALRFADNRGLLNTNSAQTALDKGKLTPQLQDAAAAAQGEVVTAKNAGIDQGKDYLPGIALGYPENNSARSFAASEQMAEAGPTLISSGLYDGSERINPYTGKFDGPPSAPADSYALADKMEAASVDILAARKQTVGALDAAMQTINRQSPGEPKVRGVMFDGDMVVPALQDLKEVINKRNMLVQSQPIGAAMQDTWNKVNASFEALNNGTGFDRYVSLGPSGSYQKGELTPTQTLSMIENMNAVRKSLGEFDEMARANGLNSTHNDFAGRAAELYSLGKVQSAAQSALESKATEILRLAPSVSGFQSWQQSLMPVGESSLATMNKTYGALQTAKEAAITYGNTTNRGMVTPEPGRLITAQGQQASVMDQLMAPKQTLINKVGDAIGLGSEPVNRSLQNAQNNLGRPSAAISQVLDGLLLREKPVPILSRDWENVKADPDAIAELGNRALALGILKPGQFDTLSDPQRQQLHAVVAQAHPQGMEQLPGGVNVINGDYQDPMEKDLVVKQALNGNPRVRAKVIGSSFQNKYVPLNPTQAQPKSAPKSIPDLGQINSMIEQPILDSSFNHSQTDMLSQLERMTAIHDEDVQ